MDPPTTVSPLLRSAGMQPTPILTGIYGARGEKIKHVTYKGALQLPPEALDVILPSNIQRVQLPSIDSVVRPSADPHVASLVVTDVYSVTTLETASDGTVIPENRTVAKNRVFEKNNEKRLRGGGEEEQQENEPQQQQEEQQQKQQQPPSTTLSAAAPTTEIPTKIPTATTSTTTLPTATAIPTAPVQSLDKKPPSQWEQHVTAPTSSDEPQPPTTPDWFHPDQISTLEQAVLPEWFDQSAPHRTPRSYLSTRQQIIRMGQSEQYLTVTVVRRTLPGDVGSLLRLHQFLTAHGLVNAHAHNESAPAPLQASNETTTTTQWNDRKRQALLQAVVDQAGTSGKRPKIDWQSVAEQVGGTTALECERHFLNLPLPEDSTTTSTSTTTTTNSTNTLDIKETIPDCDPTVLKATLQAAFQATEKLDEAQKASRMGLSAAQALETARSEEDALSRIANEVIDLRMQQLEARMAMMDEWEGLLESERLCLELERRDLYTARCRHWFGGP